jgi:hypothetical protein
MKNLHRQDNHRGQAARGRTLIGRHRHRQIDERVQAAREQAIIRYVSGKRA